MCIYTVVPSFNHYSVHLKHFCSHDFPGPLRALYWQPSGNEPSFLTIDPKCTMMCTANSSFRHLFHFLLHIPSPQEHEAVKQSSGEGNSADIPPLHLCHVPGPILFNHCVSPLVNKLHNKIPRLQVGVELLYSFTSHFYDIFNDIHAVIGGKLLNKRRRASAWEKDYAFQIILGAT